MTKEEAIKVLTEQLAYSDDVLPARLKEAYEVAINSICTISQNATEKEKIFADFNDRLQLINSEYGLSYYLYSNIYNIGKKLADKEYQQGKAEGESIGITRVLDILEHLDTQMLQMVKDTLYCQDYTELKEQNSNSNSK